VPTRPGPQLANSAKIAEVHHKHYGIYEKLPARSVQAGVLKVKIQNHRSIEKRLSFRMGRLVVESRLTLRMHYDTCRISVCYMSLVTS